MSLRPGDARGTSALRALVIVGVTGATLCGWVLVHNGGHTAAIGAASCPGCAGTASPAAGGTSPSAAHFDAAHDSGSLGDLIGAGGPGTGGAGSAVIRTGATTHTSADTTGSATPPVTQVVQYSVNPAGNGTWLAVLSMTGQTSATRHDWTMQFALPDIHMVVSDYGTITHTGDVITVAATGKPLPRDGVVRILVDLGQQDTGSTAPWPTDCQINQAPCAVTGATPTPTPSATGQTGQAATPGTAGTTTTDATTTTTDATTSGAAAQ